MKMSGDVEGSDHVAQLEVRYSRLVAMGSLIGKQMKVTILLSELSEQREIVPAIASILVIHNKLCTVSYVTSRFIEGSKQLKNRRFTSSQEGVVRLATRRDDDRASSRKSSNRR